MKMEKSLILIVLICATAVQGRAGEPTKISTPRNNTNVNDILQGLRSKNFKKFLHHSLGNLRRDLIGKSKF